MSSAHEGAAAAFAAAAHRDQVRKYTGEAYIVHPAAVVLVARKYITIEGVCGAWLHDVVEDTPITLGDIEQHFGRRVREIVSGLTSWSKHPEAPKELAALNRAKRKEADLGFLAKQDSEIQTIKYADLIDNTRTIAQYDRDFARVYLYEKSRLLEAMQLGRKELRDLAFAVLKAAEVALELE